MKKIIVAVIILILGNIHLFSQDTVDVTSEEDISKEIYPVQEENNTTTPSIQSPKEEIQPESEQTSPADSEINSDMNKPQLNQASKNPSNVSTSKVTVEKDEKSEGYSIPTPIIDADIPQLEPPLIEEADEEVCTSSLLTKIFDDEIPLLPNDNEKRAKTVISSRQLRKRVANQPDPIENLNYYPKQKEEALKNYDLEGFLNINTANLDQLQMLPMIDYRRALAIIDHRIQNGDFKELIDVENVLGIDNLIFNKIYPYILLNGESSLKYIRKKY